MDVLDHAERAEPAKPRGEPQQDPAAGTDQENGHRFR
jgi:hypothetical protein